MGMLFQLANYPAGIPRGEYASRDIFNHHATGTNHTAVAYGHAGIDDGGSAPSDPLICARALLPCN
jgi:hypothetical protein